MISTLLMTTTSNTPSKVPVTVPVPPVIRAPPSTTAAITSISMPTRSNGLASRLLQTWIIPARPASAPV